jgi:hypothetical protein
MPEEAPHVGVSARFKGLSARSGALPSIRVNTRSRSFLDDFPCVAQQLERHHDGHETM